MSVEFRRYVESDIEELLDRLQENLSCRDALRPQGFSREKVKNLLVGNLKNTQFFCTVAVLNKKIIGCFCASVCTFIFSYEAQAADHIFLILKEHRSILVATGLVVAYIEWAKARKVKKAELRNVTGEDIELFAKLAERFGFKLIGTYHALE